MMQIHLHDVQQVQVVDEKVIDILTQHMNHHKLAM